MLNYNSLASKPEMSRMIDGKKVSYKDLLCHTLSDEEPIFEGITFIKVTDDYVARPDLISLAVYGTDQYADILCKINGISNPFELMEGNILICPREEFINRFSKAVSDNMDGLASTSSSLLTKKQSFKKNKDEKRSPNEATVFDHNYVQVGDTNLLIY